MTTMALPQSLKHWTSLLMSASLPVSSQPTTDQTPPWEVTPSTGTGEISEVGVPLPIGNDLLKDQILAAHRKATKIWMDDKLINFLSKYKSELYDALMDFIADPNYLTLEFLSITMSMNLRCVQGQLTPARFQAVMEHIDNIDDMRAAHLA